MNGEFADKMKNDGVPAPTVYLCACVCMYVCVCIINTPYNIAWTHPPLRAECFLQCHSGFNCNKTSSKAIFKVDLAHDLM